MNQIYRDIEDWLKRITTPQDKLNGHCICPFARSLPATIYCEKLNPDIIENNLSSNLTIFLETQTKSSFEELKNLCKSLNSKHLNYVFLPDHPNHVTTIQDIPTGNGKYPLIIMQTKKELSQARSALNRSDYYHYWSKEYLKEIHEY